MLLSDTKTYMLGVFGCSVCPEFACVSPAPVRELIYIVYICMWPVATSDELLFIYIWVEATGDELIVSEVVGSLYSLFRSEVAGFLCVLYIFEVTGYTYNLYDVSMKILVYTLSNFSSWNTLMAPKINTNENNIDLGNIKSNKQKAHWTMSSKRLFLTSC